MYDNFQQFSPLVYSFKQISKFKALCGAAGFGFCNSDEGVF